MSARRHDEQEEPELYEEEKDPLSAECPICHKRCDAEWSCPHLAIFAEEDFFVDQIVGFAGAEPPWAELSEELPEETSTSSRYFMQTFVEPCCRSSWIFRRAWDGNCPGLSGFITYIWARHPDKLADRIQARFRAELNKSRKDKRGIERMAQTITRALKGNRGVMVPFGRSARNRRGKEKREPLPASPPSAAERRKRLRLFRIVRYAQQLSGDVFEPCWRALHTLERFGEGAVSHRALRRVRDALEPSVAAAGVVGVAHGCVNAASLLACHGAMHSNLEEAISSTKGWVATAMAFAQSAEAAKPGRTTLIA